MPLRFCLSATSSMKASPSFPQLEESPCSEPLEVFLHTFTNCLSSFCILSSARSEALRGHRVSISFSFCNGKKQQVRYECVCLTPVGAQASACYPEGRTSRVHSSVFRQAPDTVRLHSQGESGHSSQSLGYPHPPPLPSSKWGVCKKDVGAG